MFFYITKAKQMFPNQAVFQKFYKAPIKLEMSIIELDQTIFHFPTK